MLATMRLKSKTSPSFHRPIHGKKLTLVNTPGFIFPFSLSPQESWTRAPTAVSLPWSSDFRSWTRGNTPPLLATWRRVLFEHIIVNRNLAARHLNSKSSQCKTLVSRSCSRHAASSSAAKQVTARVCHGKIVRSSIGCDHDQADKQNNGCGLHHC
ncbi:hypothetical protein BSKO_04568 [Bryopsis sp. KO-2023]|nr:hypothetical protein BSKO_04568 [Bryopsis sp. KO-2023]